MFDVTNSVMRVTPTTSKQIMNIGNIRLIEVRDSSYIFEGKKRETAT